MVKLVLYLNVNLKPLYKINSHSVAHQTIARPAKCYQQIYGLESYNLLPSSQMNCRYLPPAVYIKVAMSWPENVHIEP